MFYVKEMKTIPADFALNNKNIFEFRGLVEFNFYMISDHELQDLKEYSDSSSKFEFSLFFFALFFAIVIALTTCDVKNKMFEIILICLGCITFSSGVFCYLLHLKSKRRIGKIVEKIKKTKCILH